MTDILTISTLLIAFCIWGYLIYEAYQKCVVSVNRLLQSSDKIYIALQESRKQSDKEYTELHDLYKRLHELAEAEEKQLETINAGLRQRRVIDAIATEIPQ